MFNSIAVVVTALAGLASVILTFFTYRVARKALTTWKDEKEHNLIIRSLALASRSKGFIHHLRNPVSMDTDIDKELREELNKFDESVKRALHQHYVIVSRRKQAQDLIQQISEVYELCNAQLKKEHILTKYYKFIRDTDIKVSSAGYKYGVLMNMITEGSLNRENYKDDLKSCSETIYEMKGDLIHKELEKLYRDVETYRDSLP